MQWHNSKKHGLGMRCLGYLQVLRFPTPHMHLPHNCKKAVRPAYRPARYWLRGCQTARRPADLHAKKTYHTCTNHLTAKTANIGNSQMGKLQISEPKKNMHLLYFCILFVFCILLYFWILYFYFCILLCIFVYLHSCSYLYFCIVFVFLNMCIFGYLYFCCFLL